MDEQKFTGEPLNLSFPAVQKQQKTNGQDEHVASPAVSGDIVDTSWDFQPLTFPSFADEIDQKGPRHAAPKRGVRGSKSTNEEHADESSATQDNAAGSTPGQAVPNAVFLPSTPAETVQHDERNGHNGQAAGGDAQQTAVLTSRQSLVGADGSQTAKEPSAAAAGKDSDEKTSRRSCQSSKSSKSGNSHGSKGKGRTVVVVLIAIVAVIAIVAGAVVLWRAGQSSRHEAAVNDCAKAAVQYNSAKKNLDKALASAKSLQSVSESQVGNGKTIQQLKQQLDLAKQFSSAPSCAAKQSTSTLQTNAKAMNEQISDMTDSTKSLRKAVNAVSSSKAVKDLQTLKDTVATAQKLMDSSQGMVSDESTRTALQKAIDAANALISKNSSDDAAITDAISALNSASDGVNDSMSSATSQSQSNNGYDTDSSTSNGTYGYNTYGYGYGNGTYGNSQYQYYNGNTGSQQSGTQSGQQGTGTTGGDNSGSDSKSDTSKGTSGAQSGSQNGNGNGNGGNSGSNTGNNSSNAGGANSNQSGSNNQ